MAPFYFFYAIAEVLSGACCGLGETLSPMITTLVSICLLRVCGIWFVLPAFETMECIIWIYIASWIAAGVAFFFLFLQRSRKKLQVVSWTQISIPPLQVRRALSGGWGGCLCQCEVKAPTDRSQSDCVHEQVAKRIANVRFTADKRSSASSAQMSALLAVTE